MGEAVQALCFVAGANSIFYGEKLLTTGNPDVAAGTVGGGAPHGSKRSKPSGDGGIDGAAQARRLINALNAADGSVDGTLVIYMRLPICLPP